MPLADDSRARALALAYHYLGRRERTEAEVRHHLEHRDVLERDVESVVRTLTEQGYLDDARFVRLFAEDKRELEQWGIERIRRELQRRGIDRALVDDSLADEAPEQELARALALLAQRFPAPLKTRRDRDRALGMMLRKGYDSELALEALAAHGRAHEAA